MKTSSLAAVSLGVFIVFSPAAVDWDWTDSIPARSEISKGAKQLAKESVRHRTIDAGQGWTALKPAITKYF